MRKDEKDYEDLVAALNGYTEQLKKIYLSVETYQLKRRSQILAFFMWEIAIITTSLTLVNFAKNFIKNAQWLGAALVFLSPIVILSLVLGVILIIKRGKVKYSQDKLELNIKRKQLIQVIKYASQYNEHSENAPIQRFLMEVKLSEAEEMIFLSEKYDNGMLGYVEFKAQKRKESESLA